MDYSLPLRSIRRHHFERLKKKRSKYRVAFGHSYIQTPALCSCSMCGNPRKFFKQDSLKERSAKEFFRVSDK